MQYSALATNAAIRTTNRPIVRTAMATETERVGIEVPDAAPPTEAPATARSEAASQQGAQLPSTLSRYVVIAEITQHPSRPAACRRGEETTGQQRNWGSPRRRSQATHQAGQWSVTLVGSNASCRRGHRTRWSHLATSVFFPSPPLSPTAEHRPRKGGQRSCHAIFSRTFLHVAVAPHALSFDLRGNPFQG